MAFQAISSILRRKPLIIIGATLLAITINLHPYMLFHGASLVLGLSVAFLILFLLGTWQGLIVATGASLVTIKLWGQPYSCCIFMLEFLIISGVHNSKAGRSAMKNGHIIIVDFVYWLAIGGPLYFLTHHFLMKLARDSAIALAQKAVFNGVINILIGYLIYAAIILFRNQRLTSKPTLSIQALSLITINCLTALTLMFSTVSLYRDLAKVEAGNIREEFLAVAVMVFEEFGKSHIQLDADKHIAEYLKDRKISYILRSPSMERTLIDSNKLDEILSDYTRYDGMTEITHELNITVRPPNSISLWLPKESRQKILLERFEKGYWVSHIFSNDGKELILARSASTELYRLTHFYVAAFNVIICVLVTGVALSYILSRKQMHEFNAIFGDTKKQVEIKQSLHEQNLLVPSPIIELQELVRKVNDRTVVIEESKKRIEALNKIAQQQLSTAGEIQQCFLKSNLSSPQQANISLLMRPAYNAGGDWYDAFEIDGKTFIVVADVCDKGIGAALFMSVFRSLIRYSAEFYCSDGIDDEKERLDQVISCVNDYMGKQHADTLMFATVFLACISHARMRVDYILAGHEEPILLHPDGSTYKFELSGPAIGLFPNAIYQLRSTPFYPGSLLIGYSDGVVDARNNYNEPYGHVRLTKFVKNTWEQKPSPSAEAISNSLINEIDCHIGEEEQFDDITIVVVTL